MEKNVEIGKTYEGEVTKILGFGAFVMILPEVEGLLHISQIAPVRIGSVDDILKEGSTINVKCVELDGDKIRLTMKEVEQHDPEVVAKLEKVIASGGVPAKERQDRGRGGFRNDRGDNRGSRGGYKGKSSGGYKGRSDRDSNNINRSEGGYKGKSSGGYKGRSDRDSNNSNRSEGGYRGKSSGGYKGRSDRDSNNSNRSEGGYRGKSNSSGSDRKSTGGSRRPNSAGRRFNRS
ncbi:MAG: S1 RNA-binding domain-containing protein [Proteobacteria bacterium]|nr:S1 RNA-binding domain-containing protein [Pseudomonadota bacterium]